MRAKPDITVLIIPRILNQKSFALVIELPEAIGIWIEGSLIILLPGIVTPA